MSTDLGQTIKDKARQLGFILAGVTLPEPPPHYSTFEHWLAQGHHGTMGYLAVERSRSRRADPKQILPECKSILVLATPYSPPSRAGQTLSKGEVEVEAQAEGEGTTTGSIASYAQGADYHDILPARMQELVRFIEAQAGGPVKNRWHTDTGPILERDLAQRAGLGWIGRNTCLIHPKQGSYFLLSEIFLDLTLDPDPPFTTDHCGTCTRCIQACPTDCILPDRTLDARRCISYLTIELKDDIPVELRDKMGDWVFGCDICQMVCPWNRFAPEGDPAFDSNPHLHSPALAPGASVRQVQVSSSLRTLPSLTEELTLTSQTFNQRFKRTPIQRAKRRGYLRNVAVALGNTADMHALPVLQHALNNEEPMIREHAQWAIEQIRKRANKQDTK